MVSTYARLLLIFLIILATVIRVIKFQPIKFEANKTLSLQARVASYSELKGTQQRFKVTPINEYKNFEQLTVYTGRYPQYQQGDILQISGKVREHQIISFPKILKIKSEINLFEKQLAKIRAAFQSSIEKSLPEPHASLVLGMLLGIENDVPESFETALKHTGTIHMLVVSGFNITLLSAFVLRLAGILRRRYAIAGAIVACWVFILLAGMQPPAIRAGVMTTLALLAQAYGRPTKALLLLIMTIGILLIISPELFYSLSFQLSCAATTGIIVLPDRIKQLFKKEPGDVNQNPNKPSQGIIGALGTYIKEEGVTTVAAQIAVLPLIISVYGSLSVSAPITNILVAWTVPYIMLGGLIVGLAGVLSELLGKIVASVVFPFTAFFVQTVVYFAPIKFLYLENIKINPAFIAGLYLILIYIVVRNTENKKYTKEKDLE